MLQNVSFIHPDSLVSWEEHLRGGRGATLFPNRASSGTSSLSTAAYKSKPWVIAEGCLQRLPFQGQQVQVQVGGGTERNGPAKL